MAFRSSAPRRGARARRITRILFHAGATVFISSAYAQTAIGGDMSSTLTGMLPLVLMFVVLYFVMIRPQMKRQKEHKSMIEAIAKGDEVATSGGLMGKVTKLQESHLSL